MSQMCGLLLWCLLALAFGVQAEEDSVIPVIQEEEPVDLLIDEDARIDVARMLGDLFTRDGAKDKETSEGEAKAVVDPKDQARYNKFMDTFYGSLNADARSFIDPIDILLPAKKDDAKRFMDTFGRRLNTDAHSGQQNFRASVTGIATLVRKGDVTVVSHKNGKELRSDFTIGPVSLKVNRRFGKGKDSEVRSATASSPELTGKMWFYVAANGKAKITRFNIIKPRVVTTSGTLNKDPNTRRAGNNNLMEMSIARITPLAAKKLKLAARDVLQATVKDLI